MTLPILSLLGLGFVLGLKHALDADHLAAVSTIATEKRSLLGSSLIGIWWGLGHTISLLIAGVLVMLLHVQIGPRTEMALEFCVGIMLIVLGVKALRKLIRCGTVHVHAHEHDGHWHVHPHIHEKTTQDVRHTHHGLRAGARPMLIGLVHGMAGSAALTLLVLATISSTALGFLYIGIFGVGSIGGMAIMSTVFALPSKLSAQKFSMLNLLFRGVAGLASLGLGALTVYHIAFVNHLLR
jgi:high-affinity nickel permease